MGNLVSGGAPESALTMGTIARGAGAVTLYRSLLDPRFLVTELFLMIREVLTEVGQSTRQKVRRVQPRAHRGGSVPFLRAISNVFLRDLTTRIVRSNLKHGVPAIYSTYVGYDVVAHHAGPMRPDAIKVLARLDRELALLMDAIEDAPRRYDVVVLSDHGQATGATFRQRFGQSLDDVVRNLALGASVSSLGGTTETWGHLNEVLSAAMHGDRRSARRVRMALRRRVRDGYVEIGPDRLAARPDPTDLMVCASGNLAHVYLTQVPGRASIETVRNLHPGLVEGLIDHPGVEFVMGRTAAGPIVLTRGGSRSLIDGTVEGIDPLRSCGPSAPAALRRLDEFPHAGDLVVNGCIEMRDASVAAFEDLVGSHGGLGGSQNDAFMIVPEAWAVPDRLPNGRAVHRVLCAHLPPGEA